MLLFILQTVQKFGEAAGDVLRRCQLVELQGSWWEIRGINIIKLIEYTGSAYD